MADNMGQCHIQLRYPDFDLDVAFELYAQGVLGVFGQSGSGKTSLLRCLAGLEKGARGSITIDGEHWLSENGQQLPPHQRSIGYVFQDSRLFPHMTVSQNLAYGRKRNQHRQTVIGDKDVIDLLGLGHLLQRHPAMLSGGEQQRVAIARALLSQPKLLLLDEPLASLDDSRKQEILPFLERMYQEVNIPMLYVSHSVEEVQRLCERLIVLEQGRKVFSGTMDEALISTDAPFIYLDSASVLLKGKVARYDQVAAVSEIMLGDITLFVSSQLQEGQAVSLRVLASDVSLSLVEPRQSTILNILPATFQNVVADSQHHMTLLLDIKGQSLLARISKKSFQTLGFEPGMSVYAQIKGVSISQV